MSPEQLARSQDLKRLRDEGYEVHVRDGYVFLTHVPYLTGAREVKLGILVSPLTLAGDVTGPPADHVVMFAGEQPCHQDGRPLTEIINGPHQQALFDDVVVEYRLSSKPEGGYRDYYEKLSAYANMLSGPAQAIDETATARTYQVIEDRAEESVFRYIDTATSRAGIGLVTQKLAIASVAIVGLGGTGSYILDLVAKTPVREIHLFDGDRFLQHNAFRSPGAPSIDELQGAPRKVDYFAQRYGRMRRGIVPHGQLDESNVSLLEGMSFVFVAVDRGVARKLAVDSLVEAGVPFVDVGMGVHEVDGALMGQLRSTLGTKEVSAHLATRLPFTEHGDDDYSQNIQIADLNALNATLAVIKWKKLLGFYVDLEGEHSIVYQIDGNHLVNEDKRAAD